MTDPLSLFSAPVRTWFAETFSEPTPPQAQGWPAIQRGDHTLILAPTGSGKTLAAFLWGIDRILQGELSSGILLLYISPLKALNNDIERNLRVPLTGTRATAARLGVPLPPLRVAVRTGDTPAAARAAMLKQPPHILITTPESLYLMLTSPRARELFRTVRTVIVDEIHTLCGDKRGVHLSLSLERLEHLTGSPLQRIGLSATIRPLDEAALFLGGQQWQTDNGLAQDLPVRHGTQHAARSSADRTRHLVSRPVTIVDAGYRKSLDIEVITPVEDFRGMPGNTIWPSLIPQVLGDVMRHRSTLIFCNNRRLAERTADRLNAQITADRSEELPPGSPEALAPGGLQRDRGIFAIGASGPIRAHHGSMSKESRRQMEEDLKAGKLPALVGTSSLELGIDIGAVDLVVQVQSPKSVSQALQRVGRSGHMVGQTSRGHIYATYREELDEAAALARGMLDGDVEPTKTPRNPLDVLAQQIVAMVAVETWTASGLFDLVRQASAYHDLTWDVFTSVLAMLAGAYAEAGQARAALRARLVWDRVNDRVAALPGTRLLALANAGTISDTGAYDVYLADGKTKLGQLDEEFVFETRTGDTFLLGSNTWRVVEVADDRIVVAEAAGSVPRMPFWRGDYPWRPWELGLRIGRLRRALTEKLAVAQENTEEVESWLRREYALDRNSARNLIEHMSRQLDASGVISSDRTIVVESFQDTVGESRMVIHSVFGGRVNGAWALALSSALRERIGVAVEIQSNDDGILLRYPATGREPPADIVATLTAAEARERILKELPYSAVFGAHFRMNAARALLLPKARGHKRTPFWLQRLKAKDLLASVRQFDDFPILIETYRDCLSDVLDLPHLEQLLEGIERGEIRVTPVETLVPSPVAAGLLNAFISVYMYESDAPKAERQLQAFAARGGLLDSLWGTGTPGAAPALKPEAVAEVAARATHTAPGYTARSADELAVHLVELGDLTAGEVATRCAGDAQAWLAELEAQGRIRQIFIPTQYATESRWVSIDLVKEYEIEQPYEAGEAQGIWRPRAAERILRRHLRNSGPLSQVDILARYAFDPAWLDAELARLVASGEIVKGHFTTVGAAENQDTALQFCDRGNLDQIFRRTLSMLRREVQPVTLAAYADFQCRWQGLSSERKTAGPDELRRTMNQLRGLPLPAIIWERDVLPARLRDYEPGDLAALCEGGDFVWVASGRDPRRGRVCFFGRGEGRLFLDSIAAGSAVGELGASARAVHDYLAAEGASFLGDLTVGLGMSEGDVKTALVELTLVGLVTNDTLDALEGVMTHGIELPGQVRAFGSTLEEDLAALRGSGRTPVSIRRPSRERFHEAKRRVSARLAATEEAMTAWPGRWSLVHRAAVLGPPLDDEVRGERLARLLLARYGVVMREMVEREAGPLDWATTAWPLQRMELRGEVRRGFFVQGLSGIQYALPDAVEQLREATAQPAETPVVLNAADPANVYGGEGSASSIESRRDDAAPAFARVPSTHIVLWQGQPALVADDNGERMRAGPSVNEDVLRCALPAYLKRLHAPRRLLIRQWDGASALGSPIEPLLRALGFSRTPNGLEWWAGNAQASTIS